MTVLSQIMRPFSWLMSFKARDTLSNPGELVISEFVISEFVKGESLTPTRTLLGAETTTATVQWVGNCLTLPRNLDATCYQEVISAATQIYASNELEIVVDLGNVEQIELSGLFALHCIALTMRGKTPPDPTDGWHALRSAAEQNLAAGCCDQVKLINGSAPIIAKLQANHLDRCLVIVQ